MRETVPVFAFSTQTAPAPTSTAIGYGEAKPRRPEIGIRAVTAPDRAAICTTDGGR